MYWTKSLRKGSLQRMNHMAITWCASDTMYWLNLSKARQNGLRSLRRHYASPTLSCRTACGHLLWGVCVGQRDGKHTDVLLGHEVGVEMRQSHQSCRTEGKKLVRRNNDRRGAAAATHWRGTPAWARPWRQWPRCGWAWRWGRAGAWSWCQASPPCTWWGPLHIAWHIGRWGRSRGTEPAPAATVDREGKKTINVILLIMETLRSLF